MGHVSGNNGFSAATVGMVIVAVSGFGAAVDAALVVDLGTVELLADTPGQTVPLVVSGGDAMSGLELLVVVEDGGPALQAFDPSRSGDVGPAITGIDTLSGTIFDGVATDITPAAEPQFPQFQQRFVAVDDPPGSVGADGVFAYVTFDTTTFTAGQSFSWTLQDELFSTRFIDASSPTGEAVPLTLIDGVLNIVPIPEPGSFGTVAVAAAALLGRRRRLE